MKGALLTANSNIHTYMHCYTTGGVKYDFAIYLCSTQFQIFFIPDLSLSTLHISLHLPIGYTMSQGKDNARLKSYKNKSLNTDEMRRRREEEGLQLRKQKKDEQVSKVWRRSFRPLKQRMICIIVEVESSLG